MFLKPRFNSTIFRKFSCILWTYLEVKVHTGFNVIFKTSSKKGTWTFLLVFIIKDMHTVSKECNKQDLSYPAVASDFGFFGGGVTSVKSPFFPPHPFCSLLILVHAHTHIVISWAHFPKERSSAMRVWCRNTPWLWLL